MQQKQNTSSNIVFKKEGERVREKGESEREREQKRELNSLDKVNTRIDWFPGVARACPPVLL